MLFLLALIMALAVGLFLNTQEHRLGSGVWPNYTLDALQSIEISTRGERYTLVNEPSGWVVRSEGAEPDALPTPADKARIEALLGAISHHRPTQSLGQVPTPELAGYGFAEPTVRILLRPSTLGLGEVLLTFGHEAPTGAAVYAQSSLSDGVVFLLDASILHQIDKPSEHYFDYRMLELSTDDAQRLTVTGASSIQWELERKDDTFVFLRPESLKGSSVSSSEVRLFLHNLSAICADSILTRNDRQPAGRPSFTLDIQTSKATEPLRLEVFPQSETEQVFGRSTRHPAGFLLERDKARTLFRLAFDMQWRGVITYDSARVQSARIYSVMGNQTLVAENSASGWEDRDHGRTLAGLDLSLWRLKELRFEAEPVAKLGYPAVQRLALDLYTKDAKILTSFTFYSDPRLPPDQCWLKVGSEEMFYPVGNQIIEELQGYLPSRPLRPSGE
ncbi:MAG: hypothetical protein A2051_11735 [Desulfovibrionales bacterium GWA2_65_9]|nr:MAG: hypothetical protein A2051_11735 [Desulfovibrionales bacterium GWA2_65_9]